MKSFSQFIVEKKNKGKGIDGPLTSSEIENIKKSEDDIKKLIDSGKKGSKKITDNLNKSNTTGDTPTNQRNPRRGRTSLYGNIPKDKRKVQPDANKTADNRIKDAKNTTPPDIYSKKKVSGRKNIVNPGVVRDPKTGEILATGKGAYQSTKPSQNSNRFFTDVSDSKATDPKKYPQTDTSQFSSKTKSSSTKTPEKVLERPTEKPKTKKTSSKQKVVKQSTVSKKASQYTKTINKNKIKKDALDVLKKIRKSSELSGRMEKAVSTSQKPGTLSQKTNKILNQLKLTGNKKSSVISPPPPSPSIDPRKTYNQMQKTIQKLKPKPSKLNVTKSITRKASKFTNPSLAALNVGLSYKTARDQGRSRMGAMTKAALSTAAYYGGATVGAGSMALVPVPGARIVGGLAGGTLLSTGTERLYDKLVKVKNKPKTETEFKKEKVKKKNKVETLTKNNKNNKNNKSKTNKPLPVVMSPPTGNTEKKPFSFALNPAS